jgi:hypothetical protein
MMPNAKNDKPEFQDYLPNCDERKVEIARNFLSPLMRSWFYKIK